MKVFIRNLFAAASVLIALYSNASAQSAAAVTGTVTDSSGQALVGAVVLQTGTGNATMTDGDGKYSLVLSGSEAVLSFQCMSYKTVERATSAGSVLDIILEDDANMLEETVVVGYGVQKRVNLTGAVSSINFDDKVVSRPLTNVSSALAGLSAGVNVTQSSGRPGSSATIRVRGLGTLNDSQPLVLVDGVEWDMDNVNPADIENISILKDASSAAIYGALGANGVILITTKSGKGKTKVSYNGYVSLQNAFNRLAYVDDYACHMELANEFNEQKAQPSAYSQASIDLWREASSNPDGVNSYGIRNSVAYPNTDWFDVLFSPGFAHNHHLSVSGSSEKVNYSIAAGYLGNSGVMNMMDGVNCGERKFTFQSRLSCNVTNWLTIGANVQGRRSNLGVADVEKSFSYLAQTVPGIYPGGRDAKFGGPANIAEEGTSASNLLRDAYASDGKHVIADASLSANVIARIVDGLSLEGKYNYQFFLDNSKSWTNYSELWNMSNNTLINNLTLDGQTATNTVSMSERHNFELLLRYDNTFAEDHRFGAIVGYAGQSCKSETTSATRKGYTSWDLHDLSTLTSDYSSTGTSAEWAMMSFFTRVNYSYKERYLAEFNLRCDGSSRFAPKSRWGFFPSFSAAWRINREPWMAGTSGWLSNLKLRASWGMVGNNRTSDYAWQASYRIIKTLAEGAETSSLAVGKIGNTNLKWETTKSTNIGLDFGFLQDRLAVEMDLYDKNTTGILFTPEMYLTMGFKEGSTQNLASMNNKGIEITARWSDTVGDFYYSVGANASFNRNRVTRYKGKLVKEWNGDHSAYRNNFGEVAISGFGGYICEDHMIGETYQFRTYKGTGEGFNGGEVDINAGPTDGMIRTESDLDWVRAMLDAGYTFNNMNIVRVDGLWYGDILYRDINGDGKYGDTNDLTFSGHSATPKVNYSFNVSLAYRSFDFNVLFSGAAGFWLVDVSSMAPAPARSIYKYIARDHYYYNPSNPADPRTNINARYCRLGGYSSTASDFWEYKGDYIKLKNVQLGYTLPQKYSEKIKMEKLRFYLSADNLFTLTRYPGMDPELGTNKTYPLMRQYAFGLQLTF